MHPQVRQDIVRTLRMGSPRTFQVSFFRQNLSFRVVNKDYARGEATGLPAYCEEMLEYIT